MGWSNGNHIAIAVIDNFPVSVKQSQKIEFFKNFISAMEDCDWDTESEVLGLDDDFDTALKELNPDWDWDEI